MFFWIPSFEGVLIPPFLFLEMVLFPPSLADRFFFFFFFVSTSGVARLSFSKTGVSPFFFERLRTFLFPVSLFLNNGFLLFITKLFFQRACFPFFFFSLENKRILFFSWAESS